jgi:hypothetical protein
MSGDIDDRQLQRYLLGQLSSSDRDRVLERITEDEQYFEAAEAIEAELRDAYVRGELSLQDQRDFEQHLLRTGRQKDETMLARHLTDLLDRPVTIGAPARIPRLAWWSVAAAATLAAVTAGVALENLKLRRDLDAARRARPASAPSRPAAAPPQVASLYLERVVVRGRESLPELRLSSTTQLARLETDPDIGGPLRVELEDFSGTRVWMQTLPPKASSPLLIWLPAEGLAAGIYTLRIDSAESTAKTREAVYRFRVVR